MSLPTKLPSGAPIYEHPTLGGWEPTTLGGSGVFRFVNGKKVPVPKMVGIYHRTVGTCLATRWQPGDRLWVREAWRIDGAGSAVPADACRGRRALQYRADGYEPRPSDERSPIHMPRWASRLTLLVSDVRVQRVQEISEEDARAEGVDHPDFEREDPDRRTDGDTLRQRFRDLWNHIHGPGAWDANPWVVALTVSVEQRNIDAKASDGC